MSASIVPQNRRAFLASSGAALTVASQIAAQEPAPSPFRIDCQSHLYCPDIVALMEKRKEDPTVYTRNGERFVRMSDWHRKILPNHMDFAAKLKVMDQNGILMTALSINDPGPEWFGGEGPRVARLANDFIADVVRRHPTRFFGLCVLPLQDMKASLTELDRCVGLGMKGVLLYTNLAGRFPDEAQYRPLFARAAELNLPLLLHPALPVTAGPLREYEMISALGNMFDNTIALNRLIMAGILDRYPRLQLVCPHLGGTLPFIIGRVDHQVHVLRRGPRDLKRRPSEYLRQIWFDIVSPLPQAMRFTLDMVGADRLLYSSDHPWVDPGLILGHLQSLKLPAADERRIVCDNARRLFNLKA